MDYSILTRNKGYGDKSRLLGCIILLFKSEDVPL
jgi:hypothetical protein